MGQDSESFAPQGRDSGDNGFSRALPFELPQLPLAHALGRDQAQRLFDLLVPMGMFVHALPGNVSRMMHGIAGWHTDVRQSYTDADLVIYPNIPDIVPMHDIPPTHRSPTPACVTPYSCAGHTGAPSNDRGEPPNS